MSQNDNNAKPEEAPLRRADVRFFTEKGSDFELSLESRSSDINKITEEAKKELIDRMNKARVKIAVTTTPPGYSQSREPPQQY